MNYHIELSIWNPIIFRYATAALIASSAPLRNTADINGRLWITNASGNAGRSFDVRDFPSYPTIAISMRHCETRAVSCVNSVSTPFTDHFSLDVVLRHVALRSPHAVTTARCIDDDKIAHVRTSRPRKVTKRACNVLTPSRRQPFAVISQI